jgi:tetratricopeptide (TPR) repeat protein
MKRVVLLTLSALLLSGIAVAQQSKQPTNSTGQSPDDLLNAPMTPPRSDAPKADAPKKDDSSSSTKDEKTSGSKSDNSTSDDTKPPDYSTNPPTDFPFPGDDTKDATKDAPHSYSSSKDSVGDIAPPSKDGNRPGTNTSLDPNAGVSEMKPWSPYKANNDVEIGTFYMKRGNYKAAEARFRDALEWQDNNAIATYRLATLLEKEKRPDEARIYYQSYLKILPHGDYSADCKKAIARLDAEEKTAKK